jgi:hypothetical protein
MLEDMGVKSSSPVEIISWNEAAGSEGLFCGKVRNLKPKETAVYTMVSDGKGNIR